MQIAVAPRIQKHIDALSLELRNVANEVSSSMMDSANIDETLRQMKGIRTLSDKVNGISSELTIILGATQEAEKPIKVKRSYNRKAKAGDPGDQQTEEGDGTVNKGKGRRARKPEEIVIKDESTKEDFTSGREYEPHLLHAFKELGGEAKFYEAQKKMRDLMAEQGLLKPADEEHTGKTPRKRYVALTGVRRGSLVSEGVLSHEEGSDSYTLTDKGNDIVDQLLQGTLGERPSGRGRGKKKEAVAA